MEMWQPSGALGSPISNSGLRISACTHTHTWGYKQANPRKWDEAPTTIAVVDQAMWWWWQAKICGHVWENSCSARLSSAIVSDLFRLQLSLIYVNGFKQCFLSAILILSAIFSDFVQRLPVSLYLLQVIVSSGSKTTRKQQNFFRTLQNEGSQCEPSIVIYVHPRKFKILQMWRFL